jgi:hypothetical protein
MVSQGGRHLTAAGLDTEDAIRSGPSPKFKRRTPPRGQEAPSMSRSCPVRIVLLIFSLGHSVGAQERRERRRWEDEIVYVVIVSKFCDGDPGNNVMLRRFGRDRAGFEGGFWGGDLEGVILKLDELKSIGITALLRYPVMDNDDGPFGKYLATG